MRPADQQLEPERIHLVAGDAKHVPGILGDQHPGGRAGGRSGSSTRRSCETYACTDAITAGRGLIPPQQVDQPVHRDDVPGVHDQDRQQGPLQPRAEINLLAVPVHPERAQQPEVQAAVAAHLGHESPRITQV